MHQCSNPYVCWTCEKYTTFEEDLSEEVEELMEAAENGDLETVRQLLDAGVPVDSLNRFRGTPLHIAADYGQYEVATLLIDRKCNINLPDCDRVTPVRKALESTHSDGREIAALLLRHGADVNLSPYNGSTLLSYACYYDWPLLVRLILDNGADINVQDGKGMTALMWAVYWGYGNLIALLIRAGADISVKDNRGETAMSKGIRKCSITHGLIRLFVQKGAYLENCDYKWLSKTPLLKQNVLTDVELCTQSVMNKFNRQSLPALNSITYFTRRLPKVDSFELGSRHKEDVRNLVKCEIERNTFCNVVNVRPIALSALCVLSLITISTTLNEDLEV